MNLPVSLHCALLISEIVCTWGICELGLLYSWVMVWPTQWQKETQDANPFGG